MFTNLMRSELSRLRYRRRAWGSLILMLLIGVFTPAGWTDQIPAPTEDQLSLARAELVRLRLTGDCPACVLSDVTGNVSFAAAVETVFPQAALLFAFLTFMIVVTYVGADFSSGALATQLTFTPRRGVVLAARAGASGVLGAALMLVAMGAAVASTVVIYLSVNGIGSIGAATGLLELLLVCLLYGFLLGVIAALVTFIIGNTALSMAAAVVVLFLSLLFDDLSVASSRPWLYHILPVRAGVAMLQGDSEVYGGLLGATDVDVVVTRGEAVVFHLVVVLLLALIATFVFGRRDVKG